MSFVLSFSVPIIILFQSGGWLEKVKIKLNSTQVVVEVEVRIELGKKHILYFSYY